MVALDRGGPGAPAGLDDVGVERALDEEVDALALGDVAGRPLERPDGPAGAARYGDQSAAATAESTPPDSPQIARPAGPTCARIASTVSATMVAVVQSASTPATSRRKRSSTCWPWGECPTSGWYCTPASRRSTSSKAATGAPADEAVTVKPAGASVTPSPWLIHTGWADGSASCRRPASSATSSSVRPYSRAPVWATVPPSAEAISWKP